VSDSPTFSYHDMKQEIESLTEQLAAAKEQLRIATATARALVKYADQQDDTLGKIYDLINDSGQSLATFTVQELYPEESKSPHAECVDLVNAGLRELAGSGVIDAVPLWSPEPVACSECGNDITYDCSTCAPVVDSTDFVELPETD